ncbi:hypothetical protein E2562_014949 [Oryza meyeriana var. granulata]|uniref:PIR2-like helical domain-containing protein n=1 Tax=Oryza meyeriana var. granulata TaxID=110450 RepID=A0A6G1EKC8_9ORYZ|nr:hypothetical protein E2562_014949 [Oryza meyeriana var. granulata]
MGKEAGGILHSAGGFPGLRMPSHGCLSVVGERERDWEGRRERGAKRSMLEGVGGSILQDTRVILDHIHGFYTVALDWLPEEEIPALTPCLLAVGVCIGMLDPVSNIIANAISYSPSPVTVAVSSEGEETQLQLLTREEVFFKITIVIDDDY